MCSTLPVPDPPPKTRIAETGFCFRNLADLAVRLVNLSEERMNLRLPTKTHESRTHEVSE